MFTVLIVLTFILLKQNYCQTNAFEDKKNLILSIQGKSIKIYDVFTGTCSMILEYHSDVITAYALTKNGSKLYTSSPTDQSILVFDLKNGTILAEIFGPPFEITAMELNENEDTLFCSTEGGHIIPYSTIYFKQSDKSFGTGFQMNCLKFNLYDKKIYAGANSPFFPVVSLIIVNLQNMIPPLEDKEYKYFVGKEGQKWKTLGFYFSDRLKVFLFSNSEGDLHIYNVDGKEETLLKGYHGFVNAISFNENGSLFASACSDGYIIIRNARNFTIEKELIGHNNSVAAVDFSKGRYLVTGYEDGTINIWDTANYSCIKNITASQTSFKAFVKFLQFRDDHNHKNNHCYWNPNPNKYNVELGVFQGDNFITCRDNEPNCDDCRIEEKEIACLKNGNLCGEKCLICDINGICKKCFANYYLRIGTNHCTKCDNFGEYIDNYSIIKMQTGTGVCLKDSECHIKFCKMCSNKYNDCEKCVEGYILASKECKDCPHCLLIKTNSEESNAFLIYLAIFLVVFGIIIFFLAHFRKKYKKNNAYSLEMKEFLLDKSKESNENSFDKFFEFLRKDENSLYEEFLEFLRKDENSLYEEFLEFLLYREADREENKVIMIGDYLDNSERSKSLNDQNIQNNYSKVSANPTKEIVDIYYELYLQTNIKGNSRLITRRLSENFENWEKREKENVSGNSFTPTKLGESLKTKEYIGRGSLGKVFKFKMDEKTYAIKIIKPNNTTDFYKSLKGIKIFLKAQCNQVVRLYWNMMKKTKKRKWPEIYIIMDYLNSSLKEVLESPNFKKQEILCILQSLIAGLVKFENFSKENNLVHCNIEPSNVLLNLENNSIEQDKILFANFGLAAICNKGEDRNVPSVKANAYSAPEVLNSSKASVKSDIYSLGLITLEIIGLKIKRYGKFETLPHDINWDKVNRKINPKPVDKQFYDEIKNLAKQMLSYDPKMRPGAGVVLKKLQELINME